MEDILASIEKPLGHTMKILGGSAFFGLCFALLLIYWMRPLGPASVAVLLVLSVSFFALIGKGISSMQKRGKK